MKTQFYIFVILLFVEHTMSAQSYYGGNTATHNGVTYICEHSPYFVEIYHTSNQLQHIEMTYKDGSAKAKSLDDHLESARKLITSQKPNGSIEIIKEVFGTDLMKNFKESRELLILTHTIDLNGNITEVSFVFEHDCELAKVAPDIYYQIEQKIKSRIKYTVHEEGKKYNIIKVEIPLQFWDL